MNEELKQMNERELEKSIEALKLLLDYCQGVFEIEGELHQMQMDLENELGLRNEEGHYE